MNRVVSVVLFSLALGGMTLAQTTFGGGSGGTGSGTGGTGTGGGTGGTGTGGVGTDSNPQNPLNWQALAPRWQMHLYSKSWIHGPSGDVPVYAYGPGGQDIDVTTFFIQPGAGNNTGNTHDINATITGTLTLSMRWIGLGPAPKVVHVRTDGTAIGEISAWNWAGFLAMAGSATPSIDIRGARTSDYDDGDRWGTTAVGKGLDSLSVDGGIAKRTLHLSCVANGRGTNGGVMVGVGANLVIDDRYLDLAIGSGNPTFKRGTEIMKEYPIKYRDTSDNLDLFHPPSKTLPSSLTFKDYTVVACEPTYIDGAIVREWHIGFDPKTANYGQIPGAPPAAWWMADAYYVVRPAVNGGHEGQEVETLMLGGPYASTTTWNLPYDGHVSSGGISPVAPQWAYPPLGTYTPVYAANPTDRGHILQAYQKGSPKLYDKGNDGNVEVHEARWRFSDGAEASAIANVHTYMSRTNPVILGGGSYFTLPCDWGQFRYLIAADHKSDIETNKAEGYAIASATHDVAFETTEPLSAYYKDGASTTITVVAELATVYADPIDKAAAKVLAALLKDWVIRGWADDNQKKRFAEKEGSLEHAKWRQSPQFDAVTHAEGNPGYGPEIEGIGWQYLHTKGIGDFDWKIRVYAGKQVWYTAYDKYDQISGFNGVTIVQDAQPEPMDLSPYRVHYKLHQEPYNGNL